MLCVLVVVLAACGDASPVAIDGPGANDLVFLRTETGMQAVRPATGPVFDVPGGVASFDFGVLASTASDGTSTVVRRFTPRGDVLSTGELDADLTARVVSASGDLVALTESGDEGNLYAPAPKARTRVVVVEGSGAYRDYTLDGNFEPEAFAANERELFMIEYLPALAPERYRVRRLRLASGMVLPIGRLKLNAPGQMQGTGRNQVHSPYGDELYTLYTQQDDAGHDADDHAREAHAFVHLLNLEGSWAHCIDLPHVFASGDATASALATDPSGHRLHVVDWTNGVVATVSPARVRVRNTKGFDFGVADDQTFAVASDDRLFVAGNDEIVVIDTIRMREIDRWRADAEITGLRLSSNQERVYFSAAGRVTALDLRRGETLFSLDAPGVAGLEHALSK